MYKSYFNNHEEFENDFSSGLIFSLFNPSKIPFKNHLNKNYSKLSAKERNKMRGFIGYHLVNVQSNGFCENFQVMKTTKYFVFHLKNFIKKKKKKLNYYHLHSYNLITKCYKNVYFIFFFSI